MPYEAIANTQSCECFCHFSRHLEPSSVLLLFTGHLLCLFHCAAVSIMLGGEGGGEGWLIKLPVCQLNRIA